MSSKKRKNSSGEKNIKKRKLVSDIFNKSSHNEIEYDQEIKVLQDSLECCYQKLKDWKKRLRKEKYLIYHESELIIDMIDKASQEICSKIRKIFSLFSKSSGVKYFTRVKRIFW